jgi:hypothetical protein
VLHSLCELLEEVLMERTDLGDLEEDVLDVGRFC